MYQDSDSQTEALTQYDDTLLGVTSSMLGSLMRKQKGCTPVEERTQSSADADEANVVEAEADPLLDPDKMED